MPVVDFFLYLSEAKTNLVLFRLANYRCKGLIILETYTSSNNNVEEAQLLPDFLNVEKEITEDLEYSMYNLCIKE